MKKIILSMVSLLAAHLLLAQQPDYRVVFDMSTRDSISQQALIREATLLTVHYNAAHLPVKNKAAIIAAALH